MKCPHCGFKDDRVIDSRVSKEGSEIRRRRECLDCRRRFTTYERLEVGMPMVVKKDGRRETFRREKILSGILTACEKRPIGREHIEKVVDRVVDRVHDSGLKEIPSKAVGEEVMRELFRLDHVAYVRFASVYREFKDISQFMEEVKELLKEKEKERQHARAAVRPASPAAPPRR